MSTPHTAGIAATFDWDLAERYGEILAFGARERGEDAVSVPGRLSENPFLTGVMAKHITMGIQKTGVDGQAVLAPASAGERALREHDLIPFEMSIKDGNLARVQVGVSEGAAGAERVLRDEWGFSGFVSEDAPAEVAAGYEDELAAITDRTVVLLDNAAGLLPLDPASASSVVIVGASDLAEHLRAALAELGADADVRAAGADSDVDAAGAVVVVDCADSSELRRLGGALAVVGCFGASASNAPAVVRALTGATNPSAKLPLALPGYPFGAGGSYTTFELGRPEVAREVRRGDDMFVVRVDVTNTGDRAGAEVVQIYVDIPGQPERRLVGFRSVEVAAGASETVEIEMGIDWPDHPFSVWDEDAREWVTPRGTHVLHVGTSSVDTPHALEVEL
ncbi:fibronectin type III-like domain-contianing protein [Corynebacterium sp. Q4381]|uniref:fibronectin type III-like domain-contianing protein n=1 Tax=Corynebacterium sp. Marseille-Q4381 TaxID=3121597 RepID=UPI002FE65565